MDLKRTFALAVFRALGTCALVAGAAISAASTAWAAPISLAAMFIDHTEDFDGLAGTGTSSALPPGWEISTAIYTAGNGGSATNGIYSFRNVTGVTPQADRALGSVNGAVTPLRFGASFVNNTGATVGRLDIQYIGEQWRRGGTGLDSLLFEYSVDLLTTSILTGSWTSAPALDFDSIQNTGSATRLNANLTENRDFIGGQITGLSIAPGATVWIRYSDPAGTANHGLGVDNFQITPLPADANIPEPPTVALLALGGLAAVMFGLRRNY